MKILLCDDHSIFRAGLRSVLENGFPGAEIFEAATAEYGLKRITEGDIDLVLLDLEMPGTGGWAALRKLRSAYPAVVVIIISATETGGDVRKAIEAGASGFIPKSSNEKVLRAAIDVVLSGGVYLPPQVLDGAPRTDAEHRPEGEALDRTPPDSVARVDRVPKLTPRQKDVLILMSRGLSNREISEQLSISLSTVKTHLTALFGLLDVSNRTEATLVMRELDLE